MMRARREDLRLLQSRHENMGPGKRYQWWSTEQIQSKKHGSADTYLPAAWWEGTCEDTAQPPRCWMCHFPPYSLHGCRNAASLWQQSRLRCHAGQGWRRVTIFFHQKPLREPAISFSFEEASNSFPKGCSLKDAAPTSAVAHQCFPQRGWFLEGANKIISWTPGPFASFSSLLCFTAASTKPFSILILASPI